MPAQLIRIRVVWSRARRVYGAITDRRGAFREAEGGTVFLDELGELPVELQPRLLRVLESRTVKPVGANEPVPIDVRVVAATNRNLDDMVRERRFRSDLFFRLAVIRVTLPALRDRRQDIPMLVRHFADQFALEGRPLNIRPQTMAALISHSWPGNVRELRNVVQQAVSMSSESLSLVVALSSADSGPPPMLGFEPYFDLSFREARKGAMHAFELATSSDESPSVAAILSQAAREMGLHRNMVRRILNRADDSDEGADADNEV